MAHLSGGNAHPVFLPGRPSPSPGALLARPLLAAALAVSLATPLTACRVSERSGGVSSDPASGGSAERSVDTPSERRAGPALGPAGTIVDDGGRPVPLEPPPRRIVSLVPSATDLLLELGVADRLVGRTAFDTDPALAHVPSLGRTLWPDVESVGALRPDLVLAPPDDLSGGLAERLERLGVRVYEVDAQRLEAALSTMARIAALVGERAQGQALRARTLARLDSLRSAAAGAPAVDALYLVWHSPPLVAGAGTYVDDLLDVVGVENVFADVEGWAEVSLEAVLERNPRYLIVPRGEGHSLQPEWLGELAGWRSLPAVRAGRLVVVDSDLFNRPGPRVAEAALTLAGALRPAAGDGSAHGRPPSTEVPR